MKNYPTKWKVLAFACALLASPGTKAQAPQMEPSFTWFVFQGETDTLFKVYVPNLKALDWAQNLSQLLGKLPETTDVSATFTGLHIPGLGSHLQVKAEDGFRRERKGTSSWGLYTSHRKRDADAKKMAKTVQEEEIFVSLVYFYLSDADGKNLIVSTHAMQQFMAWLKEPY